MNNITQTLLTATQYALKQQLVQVKVEDEPSFFKAMLNSGLAGVILPYIDTKAYSPKFIQKTNGVLFDFINKDTQQQALIIKIKSLFQTHQIDHIFLKGTKLKTLYKASYMRGMGDVDILVRSDLDVIKALFKELNIKLESRSLQHDQYITEDNLLIEIHPSIHKDFNPKYQTYFKGAWENASLVVGCEYTLNPTFEVIYLLYHLAKHIESSGIGLRSLLDIGIYLQKYDTQIDLKALNETLILLKMDKFYNTVLYLNKVYFDLDVPISNQGFIMSETLLEETTAYFITSGIHGKGDTFNNMAPRLAASENKGKSKFKVLWRIVFPKMVDARGMYPVLHKHGYLYPVLMVHRLFRLIVIKNKSSLKKIRNLNESSMKRNEIEKLFDDIGIY